VRDVNEITLFGEQLGEHHAQRTVVLDDQQCLSRVSVGHLTERATPVLRTL
jgi:hypothetical protein